MKDLEFLSDVALTLVSQGDFRTQLSSVIEKTGRHLSVSRVYIFQDSADGMLTSNTFEWCSPGVSPQIDALQNLEHASFPSWKKLLLSDGVIRADDVRTLPPDITAMLEPQGILSVLVYPVYSDQHVAGFIGFDECAARRTWRDEEVELLKAVSGMVASALERQKDNERLASSEKNFRTFFHTVGDMMIIAGLDGRIVYANDAVKDKLGYSAEELSRLEILDLHPADRRDEAGQIITAMVKGLRSTCPLELLRKDGIRLPVETRVWLGKWDGRECIFGISKDLSAEQEALLKFTKLFESNPSLMAISLLPDRRIVDVNRSFLDVLGYSREELVGHTIAELGLFPEPDAAEMVASQLQNAGRVKDQKLMITARDGRILCGLFSAEVIESYGNRYLLSVMVDITREVELTQKLDDQKRKLEHIICGTRLGTWEWNIQTGETVFNERWAQIIGYSLSELSPTNIETWGRLCHPEDLKVSEDALTRHFGGLTEYYDCEVRMSHKDGRWVWVHDRGMVTERDELGAPLMMFGTHADITAKKEMEEKIIEISIRDPLTNVYNRRYVFARMEALAAEALRDGKTFSVAIADIDFFKPVNDEYGHLAGDFVLREFSKIVASQLRPYDLLGRFGGEEFIVVSMNSTKEQTKIILERILEAVRDASFPWEGKNLTITFSCGVADSNSCAGRSLSIEAIIRDADARLYDAKRQGRNRVLC